MILNVGVSEEHTSSSSLGSLLKEFCYRGLQAKFDYNCLTSRLYTIERYERLGGKVKTLEEGQGDMWEV